MLICQHLLCSDNMNTLYLHDKTTIIANIAMRAEKLQKTVTTFTSLQPDSSK